MDNNEKTWIRQQIYQVENIAVQARNKATQAGQRAHSASQQAQAALHAIKVLEEAGLLEVDPSGSVSPGPRLALLPSKGSPARSKGKGGTGTKKSAKDSDS